MLGVGLLGAGFFGAVHARALGATAGARLVAVCAEEVQAAQAFAAEHGGKPYSDWRQLLDDPDVQVVVIATPHHLHCEMAVAAAKAGKHVLLEKPMGRTVAECSAIIEAVEAGGVKLMVGQLLHFALPCLTARRLIESGELGQPTAGSSALIKLWMEPNRRDWHLDPALGGGMLMTAGIHSLDLLIWLMDRPVAAISAVSGSLLHGQQADDSAVLLLRFGDGRFGQVTSIGYRDGAVTYGLDLVCEQATLKVDLDRGVSIGRGGVWSAVAGSSEPDWMLRAAEREWAAMVAAIAGGGAIPVTGEYGRHLIACIEAAFASNRERREIEVAA